MLAPEVEPVQLPGALGLLLDALLPHELERRAKRIETGSACQVAGCTRGPGCRLVPHHPTPYAQCGTTSLTDTVLLCESNHHDLHVGGKVLRLEDGRRLSPDGWLPPERAPS